MLLFVALAFSRFFTYFPQNLHSFITIFSPILMGASIVHLTAI